MLKELGLFKQRILVPFYQSENIRDILLGNQIESLCEDEIHNLLKKNIHSSLFISDTIISAETYIFVEVSVPRLNRNIKSLKITIYAFCHKDIINNYSKKGYYGNRPDILSQMIEEVLCDERLAMNFGIGKISLDNIHIYNDERKFYGRVMEFSVPNFR